MCKEEIILRLIIERDEQFCCVRKLINNFYFRFGKLAEALYNNVIKRSINFGEALRKLFQFDFKQLAVNIAKIIRAQVQTFFMVSFVDVSNIQRFVSLRAG